MPPLPFPPRTGPQLKLPAMMCAKPKCAAAKSSASSPSSSSSSSPSSSSSSTSGCAVKVARGFTRQEAAAAASASAAFCSACKACRDDNGNIARPRSASKAPRVSRAHNGVSRKRGQMGGRAFAGRVLERPNLGAAPVGLFALCGGQVFFQQRLLLVGRRGCLLGGSLFTFSVSLRRHAARRQLWRQLRRLRGAALQRFSGRDPGWGSAAEGRLPHAAAGSASYAANSSVAGPAHFEGARAAQLAAIEVAGRDPNPPVNYLTSQS